MGYSNSYQSTIGVVPSYDASYINLNASNVTISSFIAPRTDNTIDIGRPTKRFRTAYIEDIDMDPNLPASINDIPITVYDNGTSSRYLGSKHSLRPIVVLSSSTTNQGMYGVILNTVTRELVALGSSSTDTVLEAFVSNIDVDDKVWTQQFLPSYVSSGNQVQPKHIVFDSVNSNYVAFSDRQAVDYYTCPSATPNAWITVPFVSSGIFFPSALTAIRGAAFFNKPDGVYGYIFASVKVTSGEGNGGLIYSIDGGTTFLPFQPSLTAIVPSAQSGLWTNCCDLLERPDWVNGEVDRFLLLIAKSATNPGTLWYAENILGPYSMRANPTNSTAARGFLYNPYYKTLAVFKTATSLFQVYQYVPVLAEDVASLVTSINIIGSASNLPNNATTLFPFQNHTYLPALKIHVYTLRDSTTSNLVTTTHTWGGKSNNFINLVSQNQISSTDTSVNSAQFFSYQSPWTLDKVNLVGYSTMKKTSATNPNNQANYSLVSMSFLYPDRQLSNTTNSQNALISSSRMIVDKFDRIVSLSSDSITGGIGSAARPVKSVQFNNTLKSVGPNASLQVRGYSQNNYLSNINSDFGLVNPSTLGKSTSSFNAIKTRGWGSYIIANVWTENMVSSSRFVPYLNKMFLIGLNLTGNVEISTLVAGATPGLILPQPISRIPAALFSGALPFHQADIAYSPVYNTLVLSMSSGTASGNSGGDNTFYSTNQGVTWEPVQYDGAPHNVTQYGRVVWMQDMGSHGMFVMFASHLGNGSSGPSQTIMLSEEGIFWRSAYKNTLRGDNDSSSTLRSTVSVDYDPSRNLLVNTRRWISSTDKFLSYSTDAEVWSENETNAMINIYTQTIVVRTGVNDKVDFTVGANTYFCILAAGTYTPQALAKEIVTKMTTVVGGSVNFSGGYNYTTGQFSFNLRKSTGAKFAFLFSTGTNAATSIRTDIGFTSIDNTQDFTQTSNVNIFYSSTTTNNRIDLKKTAGPVLFVVYVPPGCYTPSSFATALTSAFNLPWVAAGNGAFTVSYGTGTGLFTFASSTAFELLWLTGANNTINCFAECGFAKADTATTTSRSSTVAQHWDSGLFRACAYSPSLDIWVNVGAMSSTTSPTTANIFWSKDIVGNSTPATSTTAPLAGWTPVSVFLNDGVTRPNFVDIIWAESAQLFFLLNANAGSGSANDRNIWISKDGKSFIPITTASTPKIAFTVNGNDTYAAFRLSWDNINNLLHIGIPHTSFTAASTSEIIYQFNALTRNELLSMPGCQYGVFQSNITTPSVGAVTTFTVTFDTPFTVAPTYVVYSIQNASTDPTQQYSHTMGAATTTGFPITLAGAAIAVGSAIISPIVHWIAWERI